MDGASSAIGATLESPRSGRETLGLLAGLVRAAGVSQSLASLPMRFASELVELSKFLWIRGESRFEHYYAEALSLACMRPATADIRGYETLLLAFIRFDRRHPAFPATENILPLKLNEQYCIHFTELLRTQAAFQPVYEAAAQIEAYGAVGRSRRKGERIVLLARELSGQPLLSTATPQEELYLRLI